MLLINLFILFLIGRFILKELCVTRNLLKSSKTIITLFSIHIKNTILNKIKYDKKQ